MELDIWYFARIKETLGLDHEHLELNDGVDTVAGLMDVLARRGDQWQRTLGDKSVVVAVNQAVASRATGIADEDEIAFFPPVTGG